jgi:hypothetical protein
MVEGRRMEDYPGLATRVAASVGGLRGCLILSRHGLVLGAHPDGDESVAKPSWLRFALLGEPDRSFVEFADQIWVYVHRGPYAAFAIADAGVRPGLLIDQLEQALLMAEESRTRREGLRSPEAVGTSAAGPRTPLHPAAPAETDAPVIVPAAAGVKRPAEPAPVAHGGEPPRREPPPPMAAGGPATPQPPARPPTPPQGSQPTPQPAPQPATPPAAAPPEPPKHQPPKLMTTPVTPVRRSPDDDEAEVDKVMLAQEFGGLLQELGSDDEAKS